MLDQQLKKMWMSIQIITNLLIHQMWKGFKKIIFNILGNAIKFTSNGGKVSFSLSEKSEQVKESLMNDLYKK